MYNKLTNHFKIFVFNNLWAVSLTRKLSIQKKKVVKDYKRNPFDNVPNGYSLINIKLMLKR